MKLYEFTYENYLGLPNEELLVRVHEFLNEGDFTQHWSVGCQLVQIKQEKSIHYFEIHDAPLTNVSLSDKQKEHYPVVMPDKNTMYIDVDETLVHWSFNQEDIDKTIEVGGPDFIQRVLPNSKHIDALKHAKARGHVTVVWSAGGSGWSEAVVKALNLEKYVDLIVSKPNYFFDDLRPEDFMTNRMYHKL